MSEGKVYQLAVKSGYSAGVTKYFEPGHFSTLNIETGGVEFRPWPVEN
jgi:hypothetical protein